MNSERFIVPLPEMFDYPAPDGSEIRLLAEYEGGGLSHCNLPPGKVSTPVKHKTVTEIWYCLSGKGEIWQSGINENNPLSFRAHDSFKILVGNGFQFRNTGTEPLCILIATIPKWPGPDEAMQAEGYWEYVESSLQK